MTCGNCARHASDALQSVPGVSHASVDLAAATDWIGHLTLDSPTPEATLAATLRQGTLPTDTDPTRLASSPDPYVAQAALL
jgi:copper chaperone CopZ